MFRPLRPLAPAVVALALALADGGRAAELQWSDPLEVAGIDADGGLVLADGRPVRLAGVRVPAPAKAEARALVAELILEQSVRLGTEPGPYDRYGRLVAQIERTDDLWLQGALLEHGLAQVQTRPGESARAGSMLALERDAREQRAGLWADPAFAARPDDEAHRFIGRYQIVTGRVLRVDPVGDYVYLNFGEDWRSDFTLRFRRGDVRERFEPAGLRLEDLAGRRVEVRGLVLQAGGPLIDVSHPEQIEVLP